MISALHKDPTNPRAYAESIIAIVLLSLTWVAICVRFLVRHRKQSLGLDDLFALVAQVFYTAFIAVILTLYNFVPGAQPPSLHNFELYLIWLIVCAIMYGWSMIFLKLSIGVFFLRILMTQRQRYAVYIVMVMSVTVNVIDTFWNIFSCGNPKLFVSHTLSGNCASVAWGMAESYLQNIANTGTDLALACLPFFLLRDSMMATSAKLSVGFILILATTSCICGIVAFAYIHDYFDANDYFRAIVKVGIIRLVEVGSGILAASLATMRPLLSYIVTNFKPLYSLSNRISRKSGRSLNTIMVLDTDASNQMTLPHQLSTSSGDIDPLPIRDEIEEARFVKIRTPQIATVRHDQA